MSISAATFDAVYDSIPEVQRQVRVGRDVIHRAMSTGIGRARVLTDQGIGRAVTGSVRWLIQDDIGGTQIGDVIEVKATGGDWQSFRVADRNQAGDIVQIGLENPDE